MHVEPSFASQHAVLHQARSKHKKRLFKGEGVSTSRLGSGCLPRNRRFTWTTAWQHKHERADRAGKHAQRCRPCRFSSSHCGRSLEQAAPSRRQRTTPDAASQVSPGTHPHKPSRSPGLACCILIALEPINHRGTASEHTPRCLRQTRQLKAARGQHTPPLPSTDRQQQPIPRHRQTQLLGGMMVRYLLM